MSLGSLFRATVNQFLRPLGMELTKYRGGTVSAFTMEGGLTRARRHGIEPRTILDIGASDGKWAKLALRHFPSASVIAFEPLEERLASLRDLALRQPRFQYLAAAAGDADGETGFHVANDLDGSAVNERGDGRTVPMITVDTALSQHKLPAPYLMKFDTHGFELPILAGAHDALKSTDLIIMEVYNFQLTERSRRFCQMCEHLESLGFRCCDVVDLMLRPHDQTFWQADMFFARQTHGRFDYEAYV